MENDPNKIIEEIEGKIKEKKVINKSVLDLDKQLNNLEIAMKGLDPSSKKKIISKLINLLPTLESFVLKSWKEKSYDDVKDFIRDRTVEVVIQELDKEELKKDSNKARVNNLLNVLSCIMHAEDEEDCEDKNWCRLNNNTTNQIIKKIKSLAEKKKMKFICVDKFCNRLITWYRRHGGRIIRNINANNRTKNKDCIKTFITREEDVTKIAADIDDLMSKLKDTLVYYNSLVYDEGNMMPNIISLLGKLECKLYYLDIIGHTKTANEKVKFLFMQVRVKSSQAAILSLLLKFNDTHENKNVRYRNRQEKICFEQAKKELPKSLNVKLKF